jgi:hypothetical protein
MTFARLPGEIKTGGVRVARAGVRPLFRGLGLYEGHPAE